MTKINKSKFDEVDLKQHLKEWNCTDLKSTAMLLNLMEKMGFEVNNWKVKVPAVVEKK
ncbi:hypothetical protein [Ammoniphilus sp. YIM 78166]|uniref:hypothetical protein n=1 Tax=Ammoniphilus sp. YIM 78166 TaxID=1644106 RepID=UPI0014320BED|nr:hypothetical protein [Ammoniphilus sp. YIM 78166]